MFSYRTKYSHWNDALGTTINVQDSTIYGTTVTLFESNVFTGKSSASSYFLRSAYTYHVIPFWVERINVSRFSNVRLLIINDYFLSRCSVLLLSEGLHHPNITPIRWRIETKYHFSLLYPSQLAFVQTHTKPNKCK